MSHRNNFFQVRQRTGIPSPFAIKLVLLCLLFAISGTSSFGANERDPEGYVQQGSDGSYRYFPETAASTRASETPEISEGVVVGYEQDFYDTNGAYWGSSNNGSQDRADTVQAAPVEDNVAGVSKQDIPTATVMTNRKETKSSKSNNQNRTLHSSLNGGVRGGTMRRGHTGGDNDKIPGFWKQDNFFKRPMIGSLNDS